jgi:hypothetical protein
MKKKKNYKRKERCPFWYVYTLSLPSEQNFSFLSFLSDFLILRWSEREEIKGGEYLCNRRREVP